MHPRHPKCVTACVSSPHVVLLVVVAQALHTLGQARLRFASCRVDIGVGGGLSLGNADVPRIWQRCCGARRLRRNITTLRCGKRLRVVVPSSGSGGGRSSRIEGHAQCCNVKAGEQLWVALGSRGVAQPEHSQCASALAHACRPRGTSDLERVRTGNATLVPVDAEWRRNAGCQLSAYCCGHPRRHVAVPDHGVERWCVGNTNAVIVRPVSGSPTNKGGAPATAPIHTALDGQTRWQRSAGPAAAGCATRNSLQSQEQACPSSALSS